MYIDSNSQNSCTLRYIIFTCFNHDHFCCVNQQLFKRGSTIVRDISDGVVKFKEGEMMSRLEKKWFGSYKQNPSSTQMPQQLSVRDFRGIIVITIPMTLFAFFGFIISKCRKTNLNRADVQMTEPGNGGSPTGSVGSDQTRPTDNSPEMANTPQTHEGNTGIASCESAEPSDDAMADSPARSSAEDVDTTLPPPMELV